MAKYECIQIGRALYEVRSPFGTKTLLTGYEVKAILDYFREQEWKAGIEDVIAMGDYEINDMESFVDDCMDEIRNKCEIYGEFTGEIKDIVDDMYAEMEV